jgi:outer membrane protein TolC
LVTSLKLSLVIPIFNQLETTYRIKQNKLSFEQSKIKTKIEENRITKMVLQAISDTKASSKKQEAATIAFKYAQKSYESDRLKYELGKININELNTTKTNYQNAQSELIKAKYELILNTALIRYYLGEEFTF